MDPAAFTIKNINELLTNYIEAINTKINEGELTKAINRIEDVKYLKFKKCLTLPERNNQTQ